VGSNPTLSANLVGGLVRIAGSQSLSPGLRALPPAAIVS
jgi:hypothetical protein